jgi:hypothetical protein
MDPESLRIWAVWSESMLFAYKLLQVEKLIANSIDPDQTVWMRRLFWIHAGCKRTLLFCHCVSHIIVSKKQLMNTSGSYSLPFFTLARPVCCKNTFWGRCLLLDLKTEHFLLVRLSKRGMLIFREQLVGMSDNIACLIIHVYVN